MAARHMAQETMARMAESPVAMGTQVAATDAQATQVPADQFNFKRYELKYLITAEQRAKLEQVIAAHLVADEHGRSLVSSVYYDTPSELLMRRSIEGGYYKEKLRVRSYGDVRPDSRVFIEIKKKCHGIVYKRRISSTAEAAHQALAAGVPLGTTQIDREIDGLVARYPGIEPAMLVTYERCAYHTPSNGDAVLGAAGHDDAGELRLTLDENVRWFDREDGTVWFDRVGEGQELLPAGCTLMEAKSGGALPLWFVDFLSTNGIRSRSFSKCGTAYRVRLAERLELRDLRERRRVLQRAPRRVEVPLRTPPLVPGALVAPSASPVPNPAWT